MNLPQPESSKPTFTAEQKHILGTLYGFLIELGRKRMRRLEHQTEHADAYETTMQDSAGGPTDRTQQ